MRSQEEELILFDARNLFRQGVEQYKAGDEEKRLGMIEYITVHLFDHEQAMQHIGQGYAPKFVKAGLWFMRWIRRYDKATLDKYIFLTVQKM